MSTLPWVSKLSIKLKKICREASCPFNKFDAERPLIRTVEETGLCASCYKKRENQIRREKSEATVRPMIDVRQELARRELERRQKQNAAITPADFHDLEEFF